MTILLLKLQSAVWPALLMVTALAACGSAAESTASPVRIETSSGRASLPLPCRGEAVVVASVRGRGLPRAGQGGVQLPARAQCVLPVVVVLLDVFWLVAEVAAVRQTMATRPHITLVLVAPAALSGGAAELWAIGARHVGNASVVAFADGSLTAWGDALLDAATAALHSGATLVLPSEEDAVSRLHCSPLRRIRAWGDVDSDTPAVAEVLLSGSPGVAVTLELPALAVVHAARVAQAGLPLTQLWDVPLGTPSGLPASLAVVEAVGAAGIAVLHGTTVGRPAVVDTAMFTDALTGTMLWHPVEHALGRLVSHQALGIHIVGPLAAARDAPLYRLRGVRLHGTTQLPLVSDKPAHAALILALLAQAGYYDVEVSHTRGTDATQDLAPMTTVTDNNGKGSRVPFLTAAAGLPHALAVGGRVRASVFVPSPEMLRVPSTSPTALSARARAYRAALLRAMPVHPAGSILAAEDAAAAKAARQDVQLHTALAIVRPIPAGLGLVTLVILRGLQGRVATHAPLLRVLALHSPAVLVPVVDGAAREHWLMLAHVRRGEEYPRSVTNIIALLGTAVQAAGHGLDLIVLDSLNTTGAAHVWLGTHVVETWSVAPIDTSALAAQLTSVVGALAVPGGQGQRHSEGNSAAPIKTDASRRLCSVASGIRIDVHGLPSVTQVRVGRVEGSMRVAAGREVLLLPEGTSAPRQLSCTDLHGTQHTLRAVPGDVVFLPATWACEAPMRGTNGATLVVAYRSTNPREDDAGSQTARVPPVEERALPHLRSLAANQTTLFHNATAGMRLLNVYKHRLGPGDTVADVARPYDALFIVLAGSGSQQGQDVDMTSFSTLPSAEGRLSLMTMPAGAECGVVAGTAGLELLGIEFHPWKPST